jgi:hypothetical protein
MNFKLFWLSTELIYCHPDNRRDLACIEKKRFLPLVEMTRRFLPLVEMTRRFLPLVEMTRRFLPLACLTDRQTDRQKLVSTSGEMQVMPALSIFIKVCFSSLTVTTEKSTAPI